MGALECITTLAHYKLESSAQVYVYKSSQVSAVNSPSAFKKETIISGP